VNTGMTLEKAQTIVASVVAGRKRLGKQYSSPIRMDEVLDAFVLVYDASNVDGPSKDEVTKLRRQLAACQNREKARLNKDLDKGNEKASPEGTQVPDTHSPAPHDTHNGLRHPVVISEFEVPEPESTIES
jgi:hypothetical protein